MEPYYLPYDVDCRTELELSEKDIRLCRNELELERMIYSQARNDARENLVVRIERADKEAILEKWKALRE